MGKHRSKLNQPASLQLLAKWEARIEEQKQLIAQLKAKGRPSVSAEVYLEKYKRTLLQLRNHAEIMQELVTSEGNKKA
jgi:hypothetical protein